MTAKKRGSDAANVQRPGTITPAPAVQPPIQDQPQESGAKAKTFGLETTDPTADGSAPVQDPNNVYTTNAVVDEAKDEAEVKNSRQLVAEGRKNLSATYKPHKDPDLHR